MSDKDLVETKIFQRLTETIETLYGESEHVVSAERLSKELEQMIHMLGQERSDLSELLKTMESRMFDIKEKAEKRIEAAEAGEKAANDTSAALTDRNNDVEREVAELRPELASVYSEKASLKGSATDKAANLEDQLNMAKLEHAIETTSLQRQVDFHQENTRIAREEVASLRKRLNDATKDAEKRVELANSRADEATERADEANKRVTDAIKDVYKRVELANERADAAINEANRRADEANDASKHADEATTEANRRAEEASKRAEDASRHAEEVTAEANKRADEASKRADEANERAVEALNFRLA
ncbi:hypothetical protein LTR04_007362 [Oleoguttula sp. CCFEE 6159]|nr:hypothetical protein LTR04_007362 [Oleoguttula sp. CCFEE 6159]